MARVKNNGENHFHLLYEKKSLTLKPGINEVTEAQIMLLLDNPISRNRINLGIIEILDMPSLYKKEQLRTTEKVIELIPKIKDIKLLKSIARYDGRSEVVKYAEERMNQLKNEDQKALANEHFK